MLRREKIDLNYRYPMPGYAFKVQCRACISHDALNRLSRITAPTHIIAGKTDLLAPLRCAREMADGIPNATLSVIDGGHVPYKKTTMIPFELVSQKTMSINI
jgi:pimeloyl-ACP methyl ester carboxylesterase